MQPRPQEVAEAAGVPLNEVVHLTSRAAFALLSDRVDPDVLTVATQATGETGEPCFFWAAGGRIWLDDATFGPVVDIATLTYSPDLGLSDPRLKG